MGQISPYDYIFTNAKNEDPSLKVESWTLNVELCVVQSSFHQLLFIESGSVKINSQTGTDLGDTGCLLFIPSGMRCLCNGLPKASLSVLTFPDIKQDKDDFYDLVLNPSKVLILDYPKENRLTFFSILNAIHKENEERQKGYSVMLQAKLTELLIHLARYRKKDQAVSLSDIQARLEDCRQYMDENYHEQLTLEGLAKRSGLSASYFSHKFKEYTGSSVIEYINSKRIERGCFLLKNSQFSILEIAYEIGYQNLSYFNRIFKRHLGCTPFQYRQRS